jgi:site-specific DNA-methyltransferase (adenine-specific)
MSFSLWFWDIIIISKVSFHQINQVSENRSMSGANFEREVVGTATGRWPANFIHDGSDELSELLGEPARFFYCAKASKRDRNEGLDDFDDQEIGAKGNGLARTCATCNASVLDGCECPDRTFVNPSRKNFHPTVKPTDLMRYLIKLVTPSGGTTLDPFMGSGSTGKGAMREGFNFIGIEQSAEYLEIAKARIEYEITKLEQLDITRRYLKADK